MNDNADLRGIIDKLQKTDPSLGWVYFELVRGEPGFWGFQPILLGRDESLTALRRGNAPVITTMGTVLSNLRKETSQDMLVAEQLRLIVNHPHNLNAIVNGVVPHKFAALDKGNVEVTSEGCLLICLRELPRALKLNREPTLEYPFCHSLKLRMPRGFKGFLVQYYMTNDVWSVKHSNQSKFYSQLKPRLAGLNIAPFYFTMNEERVNFSYEDDSREETVDCESDRAKGESLVPTLEQHINPLLDDIDDDTSAPTGRRFIHHGILLIGATPLKGLRSHYHDYAGRAVTSCSLEEERWLGSLDRLAVNDEWEPHFFGALSEGFTGLAAVFRQTKVVINTVELP